MDAMASATGIDTFSRTTSDIVILIARVAVGVTLLAHGWQKFFTNTIDGTSTFFESMDVPAATAAAIFAATVELVGVNTAQLGQVQGFRLTNSVEIDRVQYDGEKYLFGFLDRTRGFHHDGAFLLRGHKPHNGGLYDGDERHIGIRRNGNRREQMRGKRLCEPDCGGAVRTADDTYRSRLFA